jgi:hypothetical protein
MTTKATTKKTSTSKPKAQVVKGPQQSIPSLPKNPFVFEVLDAVSKQRTKAKKVQVLQKYGDNSLKTVLIWNFDESIISMLPPGEVPYSGFEDQATSSGTLSTKIDENVRRMHETGSFSLGSSDKQGHTTIRRESKNFYYFVKGGSDGMSTVRRETMFINILEGLHPLEAEILCLVKDKKLSEKYNITQDIVAEAYPDIVWGNRS